MADVKLKSFGEYFDLAYSLGDFESDEGLESAVVVSLFTDRRVKDDELTPGERDRKGWWGDLAISDQSDTIGSKLWLLTRDHLTESTRKRSEEYALEALQWLIDDGIAKDITVRSVLVPRTKIEIRVDIQQPGNKDKYFYRYQLLWENQLLKLTRI